MTFVVRFELRVIGAGSVEHRCRYLSAIRYDPYNMRGDRPASYVADPEDAFIFHTLAAAEVAAVMVGGSVGTLEDATASFRARRRAP